MKPAVEYESIDICSRCNKTISLLVTLWTDRGFLTCGDHKKHHTPKNHIQIGEKWYFKPDFNEYLELTSDL